jgi:hypothetical protein
MYYALFGVIVTGGLYMRGISERIPARDSSQHGDSILFCGDGPYTEYPRMASEDV